MQIEEKGEVLGTGQWLSPTRKSPCKQTAPKDFTGTVWPKQVSQISSQKANQTKHTFLSQCLPSTSHSVCYHQHLHSSLTQLPAHKMRFVEIPQEKCLELEKISQKEKKKKDRNEILYGFINSICHISGKPQEYCTHFSQDIQVLCDGLAFCHLRFQDRT